MRPLCILLLATAVLVLPQGCRRKPPAPIPTATPDENASSDQLPAAPNDSSLNLPVQQELTSAIHLYQLDNRKLPPDFETLVKEKYLKALPAPPPGKRFGLDRTRMQVVIMD